jgi:hypothetical protein
MEFDPNTLAIASAIIGGFEETGYYQRDDVIDIAGPYTSFAEVIYYVEMVDGKTYTVTVKDKG